LPTAVVVVAVEEEDMAEVGGDTAEVEVGGIVEVGGTAEVGDMAEVVTAAANREDMVVAMDTEI